MSVPRAVVLASGGVLIVLAGGAHGTLPAAGIGLLGAALLIVTLARFTDVLLGHQVTTRGDLLGWVIGLAVPLAWVIAGSPDLMPAGVMLGALAYLMVCLLPRLFRAPAVHGLPRAGVLLDRFVGPGCRAGFPMQREEPTRLRPVRIAWWSPQRQLVAFDGRYPRGQSGRGVGAGT